MNLIATNQDFKKLMDFLGQELLYTNYSMTRMQRIEDKISKEYFGIMSSFNIQPLHYDNWVYFTKDPNLNSQSIFDIYRVPVQRNNVI